MGRPLPRGRCCWSLMEQTASTDRPDLNIIIRPMMMFRLIIATAFLFVGFLVLKGDSYPFYLLIGAFYLMTIFYLLVFQRRGTPASLPYFQITIDVIIVTSLILVAKSMGGIFLFLYLIPIISASLYFDMKQSIVVALGCGLTYCSIILGKYYSGYPGAEPDISALLYSMFLNLVIFHVVGFLCGYLAKLVSTKGLELSKLQNMHNLILNSMNSGLISVDVEGRIVYANTATQQMTGFTPGEIKGKPIGDVFSLVAGETRTPLIVKAGQMETEHGPRAEALSRTSQGDEIPIGYNVSSIRDQDGRVVGGIIVFTDLTRVKGLEEKLRQADKLRAVGELAAGIAHEIRNPLAAISGSIEMLAECTDADDGNKRLFNVILKESSRLNGIIEGFLNYTRNKPPDLQRISARELLDEIALLMRQDPVIQENIAILVDIDDNDIGLYGDPGQLKQVLINLVKNAADSMPRGGEIRLKAGPSSEPGFANLVVSDNGCGIPEETLGDVFNPFFTTKSNGMGIGLSVAEKIVRSHGGQISVQSGTGEGTAFKLILPSWQEKEEMAGAAAYGENSDS